MLTVAAAPAIVRLLGALLGPIPEDAIIAMEVLGGHISLSDWQALWLAFFASFGAPLGGILASAAKRAVEMKDFGQRCVCGRRCVCMFVCILWHGVHDVLTNLPPTCYPIDRPSPASRATAGSWTGWTASSFNRPLPFSTCPRRPRVWWRGRRPLEGEEEGGSD